MKLPDGFTYIEFLSDDVIIPTVGWLYDGKAFKITSLTADEIAT